MSAEAQSPVGGSPTLSPIVEFRRYTLQPGAEDAFVGLFEREFIETLEADGMRVIGQFRDVERQDRFVWVRGFADMETRKRNLTAFYVGGAAWTAHGPAANAMIVDSDDVMLLRPAWPGSGFASDLPPHPPLDSRSPISNSIVVAVIDWLDAPADQAFLAQRRDAETQALTAAGVETLATFVTEPSPNNFPRHPVRENENVFVRFARLSDRAAFESWRAAYPLAPDRKQDIMVLSPTPRSRVR